MSNETNVMTEELVEMVTDNSDVVIEAAEQYVPKLDFMGFMKGCGKVGTVLLAGYGTYRLVKDVIVPMATSSKKQEVETVDCTDRDYTEATDESEVDVTDEE